MKYFYILILCTWTTIVLGQQPAILADKKVAKENYLPDFSYAGYESGLTTDFQLDKPTQLHIEDFGAKPNDNLDDTKAIQKAMAKAHEVEGPVEVIFPAGEFILSEVLFITRSNIVLTGDGSGDDGTVIYCPRPMSYMADPEPLKELREYLVKLDKRQKEPQNNIDLPFSQYAWSGGMIWTYAPGERIKTYLPEYNLKATVLAHLESGKMGALTATVDDASELKKGDVVQVEWFNKGGEKGALLDQLYKREEVKIGSHHWEYPDEPLVKQQLRIVNIKGNTIEFSGPLLLDINKEWAPQITAWKHLEHVGVQHLQFKFPMAPNIAHHVEEGYNAIYLTRLFDGWVNDVVIKNADSGILTEESASLTISNITTSGDKIAHYSVYIGGVHNVLVDHLKVYNEVRHALSFNTLATKNVYTHCEVFTAPVLDQHAGANHQNLFDDIVMDVDLGSKRSYPLFKGGGAGYWKPSHGAYSTFWNINLHFKNGHDSQDAVLLNGMDDGSYARLVGIHADLPVKIEYGPDAYIELTNKQPEILSLYQYQLEKRKRK
ncbi:glycoside hydrolase family 55 protein [Fulvivirga ligni]|uniref:glycoside hydrolase family 55 protein n=1 Tax=Fulvivirga ligni TaxID=2904246 RepID=UPI001F1C6DD1|nr:glycoside hydrolase family 55 protein [Fulvivirga ligni]UII23192.1 glycoside hydrolase family 55 protein [Fulvivirga ligni]